MNNFKGNSIWKFEAQTFLNLDGARACEKGFRSSFDVQSVKIRLEANKSVEIALCICITESNFLGFCTNFRQTTKFRS